MRLPRFIHHIYASARGYFWMPCPHCGQSFGGHEVISERAPYVVTSGLFTRRMLCPTCTRNGVPWPVVAS